MNNSVGSGDVKCDGVALSGWRPDADVVIGVPRHGDLLAAGRVQDGLAGRDVLGEDGSGNNVTQEDSCQGRCVCQKTIQCCRGYLSERVVTWGKHGERSWSRQGVD